MSPKRRRLRSRVLKSAQLISRMVPVLVQPRGFQKILKGRPRSLAAATIVSGLRREMENDFSLVIDGGANVGQFAWAVSQAFPRADVRSFEPVSDVFKSLSLNLESVPNVTVENMGLGATTETTTIHVNAYRHASSILRQSESGAASFDKFREESIETIQIIALDEYLEGIEKEGCWLLKLDVQGYELQVLQGAQNTIEKFDAVLAEIGIRPTYEGEASLPEMLDVLSRSKHRLQAILDVTRDDKHRIVQIDALFVRDGTS